MSFQEYFMIAALAYLIGSFSFGILISSLKGRDIRQEGSKSSGATNVTRVLGPAMGLLTFLGDFLKAALAIWVGYLIRGTQGALVASVFAVIGHNWPAYYQFRGGKGVVCSIAVVILMAPLEGIISGAIAIGIIWATKYVSLGSLGFMLSAAILLTILRGPLPYGVWALILLVLGIFQHRSNIQRLLEGKENKLSFKR